MTWQEFAAARRLLAEVGLGAPLRRQMLQARADEDEAFAETAAYARAVGN